MSELEKVIAEQEIKYLTLLSGKFKNIGETATEIINLQAILNLPKGTEHFLSDIHGEYEAFNNFFKSLTWFCNSFPISVSLTLILF